jgi:hypothetical protein
MYTDEQVRIIKTLREDDVKWSTIAKAVQKSEGALMTWWNRNRLLVDLPPKTVVSKKKTAGRVGMQIKRLVNSNRKYTVREMEVLLQAANPDKKDLPKKSTINKYLLANDLVIVKLLKRPLVSQRNRQKSKKLPCKLAFSGFFTLHFCWTDCRKCSRSFFTTCHHQTKNGGKL